MVMNTCLDVAEKVTLSLRSDKKGVRVSDRHCAETKISSSETNNQDSHYSHFILPVIPGWDMRLIVTG